MNIKSSKKALTLLSVIFMIFSLSFNYGCGQKEKVSRNKPQVQPSKKSKITFIELGSVNCVPCRKMQPILKHVEKKYGDQIEVIFYDVWKAEQRKFAEIYGIRLIPTQIFLDEKGKELFRHEGYFPETEIDRLLADHGLKIKKVE